MDLSIFGLVYLAFIDREFEIMYNFEIKMELLLKTKSLLKIVSTIKQMLKVASTYNYTMVESYFEFIHANVSCIW